MEVKSEGAGLPQGQTHAGRMCWVHQASKERARGNRFPETFGWLEGLMGRQAEDPSSRKGRDGGRQLLSIGAGGKIQDKEISLKMKGSHFISKC